MATKIDYNKHIWEGWSVLDFINELDLGINMIMRGQSHINKFKSRSEVKKYCIENQPYYKKYIPEVVNHYCIKFNIK